VHSPFDDQYPQFPLLSSHEEVEVEQVRGAAVGGVVGGAVGREVGGVATVGALAAGSGFGLAASQQVLAHFCEAHG